MSEPQVFRYNPTPAGEPTLREGATRGWIVNHHGPPTVGDPVQYAEVVILTDSDGIVVFEVTGEWCEGKIVDG